MLGQMKKASIQERDPKSGADGGCLAVLTWVSLYTFSKAGPAASIRTYYALNHWSASPDWNLLMRATGAPVGISYFPKELHNPPSLWARTIGNVVWERTHSSGGHFAVRLLPSPRIMRNDE